MVSIYDGGKRVNQFIGKLDIHSEGVRAKAQENYAIAIHFDRHIILVKFILEFKIQIIKHCYSLSKDERKLDRIISSPDKRQSTNKRVMSSFIWITLVSPFPQV